VGGLLLAVVDDVEELVEFVGGEVDLLVVVEVVPLLHLGQEVVGEFGLDDWRDLQQEVEFLDQALAEGEVGPAHVVLDDVAETAVGGVAHEFLDVQLVSVEVQLAADGDDVAAIPTCFLLFYHFL
jgi:hypothetical protein